MTLKNFTNKLLKLKNKKNIPHTSTKLFIGLGTLTAIGVLIFPNSVKKLFEDLKKKDMTKANDSNKIAQETDNITNNTKDKVENKDSKIKNEAVDLINHIQDASKEVKEDIKKDTEVLSNEVNTLNCSIKEELEDSSR